LQDAAIDGFDGRLQEGIAGKGVTKSGYDADGGAGCPAAARDP